MGIHVSWFVEEETGVEERLEENLGPVEETNLGSIEKTHLGRRLQENLQDRAAKVLRWR